MRTINKILLALSAMLCFSGMAAYAQSESAPRWTRKGVKELNHERSNDTYTFVEIDTHSPSLSKLQEGTIETLKKYMTETYGADASTVTVKTDANGAQPLYTVTFTNQLGENNTIIAKLVDEYYELDDYELNTYEFEYYRLFAMSRPNTMPEFDTFKLSHQYNAKAVAMSIVPGMGQIYKGQDTKGYVIMGGEAALVAATLVFEYKRHDCEKWRKKEPLFDGSWRSKAKSWGNFRNGAIGCALALYIYNFIDAAVSKGSRYVEVTKPQKTRLTLAPYVTDIDAGMTLCINF